MKENQCNTKNDFVRRRRAQSSLCYDNISDSPAFACQNEPSEHIGRRLWVAVPFITIGLSMVAAFGGETYFSETSSRQLSSHETESFHQAASNRTRISTERPQQCRIYMAPSSLQHGGYGVYTTESIKKDEPFLKGADGPSIVITDFDRPSKTNSGKWIEVFDNYWWGRGVPDAVMYESMTAMDFQITFGSLPNHHCVLDSVDHRYPDVSYEDSWLDPRTDAGVGAYSYHMGRIFTAMRDLDAGEELFLNYGYCGEEEPDETQEDESEMAEMADINFSENLETETLDSDAIESDPSDAPSWVDHIPKDADYRIASEITLSLWQRIYLYEQMRRDVNKLQFQTWLGIELAKYPLQSHHVRDLLPKNVIELKKAITSRKGDSWIDLARSLALLNMPRRSVDWIRENGLCVENLLPGRSTIEQAGQGAFAQFPLKEGEIIVPMPILQIMDQESMKIPQRGRLELDGKSGMQLLTNYCFGHDESSILLCPNTNAILVNHCSTRKMPCGPKGPNAIVRWASGWEPRQDEWINMSLEEMGQRNDRGLAMELVALRDIEPGEEVFIDYGESWEAAWLAHATKWPDKVQQDHTMTRTASVKSLNHDASAPLTRLVTGSVKEVSSLDEGIFTGCVYWLSEDDELDAYEDIDSDWMDFTEDEIMRKYATSGEVFTGHYSKHQDGTYWPCSVLYQEDDIGCNYTVRIHQAHFAEETLWHDNDAPRILTGYPRSSIHYFPIPYKSDQHVAHAFRHPIGIPNAIFPDAWKNLVQPVRIS